MSAPRNTDDDGYVIIERTGAFFLALDIYGHIHMGYDIFREGNVLTLPGGNLEKSDRNLLVAARRETKQEFGRHMRYHLIDAEPYVFLCDIDTDELVTNPLPGQRVKLRIVWFVMETHGNVPVEQKKPEVRDPRAHKVTEANLETLVMRESSRIAIREAFRRNILPNARFMPRHKVDMSSLRKQMEKNRVPPHIIDFHCNRVVRSPPDDLLRRLELAEQAHQKKMRVLERQRQQLEKEVKTILKPGTAKNKRYVKESEALIENLILDLQKSPKSA